MGFATPPFHNRLRACDFGVKTVHAHNLGQSCQCRSFPVVSGCGGGRPGQILDKSRSQFVAPTAMPLVQSAGLLPSGAHLFCDRRRLLSTSSSRNERRRGRRSKAEIENERRERWWRTCQEVDEIYEAYSSKLSSRSGQAKGAAYARFSTRFQDSIADQIRTILDHAIKLDVFVPRELIFFDLAVRGFKKKRHGLDQLDQALRTKKATVVLLFATSRLFRKQYRTLEFVDQMHRGRDVRCVFVKSGVDTNDTQRWQSVLAVQSMVDQFIVSVNVANVQAAHEGLLKKRLVFGTLSYGYVGAQIDGEYTKLGRPRCRIEIDPKTAQVVCQIFRWYVFDQMSIQAIICQLNGDTEIPLPPHASSGTWTRLAVKHVLTNTRYRGLWRYGVTEAVYVPDGDYIKKKMRAEPLSEVQIEELRLLEDATWFAAQARLAKNRNGGGRPPKDGNRKSRPQLLNRLLICSEHQQALYVSGAFGNLMHCPVCLKFPPDQRALYSKLNRVLATEIICNKIVELVNKDPALPREVLAACEREAAAAARLDIKPVAQLQARVKQISRSIELTRTSVGPTNEDEAEARRMIAQLQQERARLQAEIGAVGSAERKRPRVPTQAEVEDLLRDLAGLLIGAASSDDDGEVARARQIIDLMTDGAIELHQMGERKAKQGWLQARFKLELGGYLVQLASGQPASDAGPAIDVIVDIKQPRDETEMRRAWQLYNQGQLAIEIAHELECSKSKVTKLLRKAAKVFGETYVDGRSRRATLKKKHLEPPLYQKIADEVVQLMEGQMQLDEIASQLDVDRNTITQSIRWWHEQRGLPVPDGRTRRIRLNRKPRGENDDQTAD